MAEKLSLDADIINCIVKSRKLLLLEGKDDPKFYEGLVRNRNDELVRKLVIRKIGLYGEGSGCTKIEEVVCSKKDIFETYKNTVLAIIDGDARKYDPVLKSTIDDLKQKEYILMLDLYSFESYCFDRNILIEIISKTTSASVSQVEDSIIDYLYQYIIEKIENELYYIGLSCLDAKINENTENKFKYSSIELVQNPQRRKYELDNFISNNKIRMDTFASKHGIKKEIRDIKSIVKGKHFLMFCATEINFILDIINKNKICNSTDLINLKEKIAICDTKVNLECCELNICNKSECIFKFDVGKNSAGRAEFAHVIYNELKNNTKTKELDEVYDRIKDLFNK